MYFVSGLFLALGIFIGNWLIVPIFFPGKKRKDQFWVGIIAALLAIILFGIFELIS